jgi:hypothetical protein
MDDFHVGAIPRNDLVPGGRVDDATNQRKRKHPQPVEIEDVVTLSEDGGEAEEDEGADGAPYQPGKGAGG